MKFALLCRPNIPLKDSKSTLTASVRQNMITGPAIDIRYFLTDAFADQLADGDPFAGELKWKFVNDIAGCGFVADGQSHGHGPPVEK
jgi:hypothetical protein